MFSRIVAMLMCVVSFFTAPFSQTFSKWELKTELRKGSYESPYIVRTLEDITVNGVSVDEYSVVAPDGELYYDAAETLCNEFYKACGKEIATDKKADKKALVIEEELNDSDVFSLKVENGTVYIKGSKGAGISRGITAFADEVMLNAQGTYDFKDGYEYTKTFSDYVTYEAFGAVGDGKTDDFEAIIKTHEFANKNGKSVFANETATYYIGGADKTAYVMTDTSWSTARFIIDDTAVENRSAWVFNVAPSKGAYSITDKVSPLKIDAENIGTTLAEKSLVVLTDSNVKRYIRKGANQNSGSNQTDVILVDENGNIAPETPLIWDFDAITGATAYPVDAETLTIKGGKFTTIANNASSEYNYYTRGIVVRRSNTVIDSIYHDIKNEGKTGAPYSAFVSLSYCADVTVKNSTFTGHKKYSTIGSAGTSVTMGTYDIGAATVVNASFINCNQTNDITDNDYWGIAGTNYCKNLVYDGCALSRFDAHQGVLNATVKNSVLGHHGIKLIGSGTALIENTTVLSDSFVDLRADYGSTWNGDMIIRNCKFYPTGVSSHIINAENSEDHNFGYTCYMPQKIEIDGFYVHRGGINYLFTKVNPNHKKDSYDAEYPVVPPQEITVKNFDCLVVGSLKVSKNKAIFKVEIA
ncbi:MAG: hypothetical protein U0K91_07005 [Acutalibacteraceae bacterium]|nr:hypothetical protein [Acutalibacteraceae bacterium]